MSQQQDDSTPTSGQGPVSTKSQGWGRLARMGRPRLTKANLLSTVLALLLGFAMVTQVQQYRASGLENMRQEDLVTLLDGVNQQGNKLGQDIDRLTRTRDSLRSGGGDAAAVKAAEDRLAALGILAGTMPATGPGIEITVTDPSSKISANNMLDTVQELRDAGAEAIQIGSVRVVANSWFGTSLEGKLIVDGHVLTGPYVVRAIGDSHTMSTALAIPGGVVETLRQLGISAAVQSKSSIAVTALRSEKTPGYAQPDTSPR
ncbi:DUF881 domain-containing protein [Yimella sp. cx-51]|uniref:DUF881 domain-containing protein n=1 Tax=Yimella sp. cx-51 TaxID=2770551 RepID=UPI00165E0C83|nr:DUF881 domain-containing protein [Yimella sp. cx-51]MBC9957775.1 DUF881 domain-containing protein [Yimella sp. cx-51]QTH36882.1 DUF881 domain-containing protein [Yimella sp. cx-51]